MLIKEVMTKNPACCAPHDTAAEAAATLWEKDCGCVPIVDGSGVLCGFVTDRDLCMAALFSDKKLSDIRLDELPQPKVLTCGPHQTVEEAETVMRNAQVRRVVVVDEDHRVIGLLSLNDLARALSSGGSAEEIVTTLIAIGDPHAHAAE